jgi:polysaccharide biosynthesis protein PslG
MRSRSRLVLLTLLAATAVPGGAQAAVPRGWMGAVAGAELGHHPDRVPGQFAAMADAGVQSTKAEFAWGRIEREKGTFDWGEPDILVAAAAQSGLDFLPTVVGAPRWAGKPLRGQEGVRHPRHARDFARFLRELVFRYGPDGEFWIDHPEIPKHPVRSWEIWNEPDIPYFWRRPWVHGYVGLLRTAHRAIKADDPGARIVLAGLVNRSWADLRDLYRAGAKPYFDTVSLHPYTRVPHNAVRNVQRVRRVMRRFHDAHTPIWVTELSWTSALGHMKPPHTDQPYFLNSTPRGQARKLRQGYLAMARARRRLGIGRVYWYSWLTQDRSHAFPFDWAGLVRVRSSGFRPKPALAAYERVARRLGG